MHKTNSIGHTSNTIDSQLPQVDVSSSIGQTEYYQQQIISLLDGEGQNEVSNFSNSFGDLLKQLAAEVSRLSSKTSYNYEEEVEYIRRIILPDEFINKAFAVILKNNKKLNSIYIQLNNKLSILPNSEIIKSHIFDKYFFDLIIEFLQPIKTDAFGNNTIDSSSDKTFFFDKYKQFSQFLLSKEVVLALQKGQGTFFDNCKQLLLDSEVIDFSKIKLDMIDFKVIIKLFSIKPVSKSWLFSDSNLSSLSDDKLSIIFNNSYCIKHISLKTINIDLLSPASLKIIFKNLKNLKIIKLDYNNLGLMNNESLEIIFSNLKRVRQISLNSTKLGLLSNEALDIIFTNLKGVKHISLGSNDFSQEQIDYINKNYFKIIFFDNYA